MPKAVSAPRKPARSAQARMDRRIDGLMRALEARGVLTGRAQKVSARIDPGLLAAAAKKLGSNNTTEVVQVALAAFVAPDPFVAWFLSDKDRLPADFELAI